MGLRSTGCSRQWTVLFLLFTCLFALFTPAVMVKHENFKTCHQSGFCKRQRAYAEKASAAGDNWGPPYRLSSGSVIFDNGVLSGTLLKAVPGGEDVRLPIKISFLESGVARVTIDEEKRQKGDITLRHDSKARKERYNEVEKLVIVGGLETSKAAAVSMDSAPGTTKVVFGPEGRYFAIIYHAPFGVDFGRDDTSHIMLNGMGLLNVEHWRPKKEPEPQEPQESAREEPVKGEQEDESTWWEEAFGGNTDSKPRGPESVGLDISFLNYEHVYGIPEHAGPLSLKETTGGEGAYKEPYRLYNADVFEYEMDSPMTLYGSIPFMQAHRKDSSVGVLWLNAAETWIDIHKARENSNPLSLGTNSRVDTQTHWFSESGLLDVFVFLGPTPKDLSKKYGELTGFTALPQSFSVAYHQCRWNYVTDEDVKDVDRKFDRHQIPYDVIWLDIEYTDGKKYFTWDPLNFPDPIGMEKQLDEHQRKLVTIIDPHIKNEGNYPVVDELKSKDLAVHNKDGAIYDGWCWPGSSHWIDCFNPKANDWWKSWFKYDKFTGTSPNVFIWNDMNEPSVFNGPETTMPKDNLHYGGWEHRDVHNLNGMTFHNATYQAILERKKGEVRRPFVLTRAFYAGSQRTAAMWTGDNQANWDHLAASIPMVLNQGIAGMPFAGADVGGFFGNPEKDLLTRWYQAGIWYPFMRGHAHIDTRRREPYLAGAPYTEIITQALRLRYSLLPAWYTAFHETSVEGTPIVRPQYYVNPSDEKGFAVDDQLYLGSYGILAKPVLKQGADSVNLWIGDEETYYDYFDYTIYNGVGTHKVHAPLEKIPVFMQGGHIIPRRDRPRRSSGLMKWDPYTLVVVLDKAGNAEGTLYVDDGETFDYQLGAYIHRRFAFNKALGSLSSIDLGTKGKKTDAYLKAMDKVKIEKVIIVGASDAWKEKTAVAVAEEGTKDSHKKRSVGFSFHGAEGGKAAWAVIRNPGVSVARGWKIDLS